MAAISRSEIAADGQQRLRKSNGVQSFEMVRQSALIFLFCDTNFVFFLNHDMSNPKRRLATASVGEEEKGRGHGQEG